MALFRPILLAILIANSIALTGATGAIEFQGKTEVVKTLNVYEIETDKDLSAVPITAKAIMCESPSDAFFQKLKRFTQLKWLDLSWSTNLTLDKIDALAKLKIEGLDVSYCNLSEEMLAKVLNIDAVEHLFICGNIPWDSRSLNSLAKMSGLRTLEVTPMDIQVQELCNILGSPSLERLRLKTKSSFEESTFKFKAGSDFVELDLTGGINIPSALMNELFTKVAVTNLILDRCHNVDGGIIRVVLAKSELTTLSLYDTPLLGDKDLELIAKEVSLTHLDISSIGDGQITPQALHKIDRLTKLRELYVSKLDAVSAESAGMLKGLSNLQVLVCYNCAKLDKIFLRSVSELKSLEILLLAGCQGVCDIGLASLAKLSSLRRLNISRCNTISREGSKSIAGMNLQHFIAHDCHWLDKIGLLHIARNSPGMETLAISGNKGVDSEVLKVVSIKMTLGSLVLSNTNIADGGLTLIGKMTNLRSLSLNGCNNISAEGLAAIVGMKSLHELYISRCKFIDQEVFIWITKKMPWCKITKWN